MNLGRKFRCVNQENHKSLHFRTNLNLYLQIRSINWKKIRFIIIFCFHFFRSLGSTSEQSLTSPAGFSSLNSLGSPASIASPSTPVSQTLESSDFRPSMFGAFKPPNMPASTATSTTPAGYQPGGLGSIPGGSQSHHHPHLHQMFQHHRPPVGTDPRDSKNPLSISQLTGNFHHPISHHLPLNHVSHHPGGPGSIPGGHPAPDKRALPLMT